MRNWKRIAIYVVGGLAILGFGIFLSLNYIINQGVGPKILNIDYTKAPTGRYHTPVNSTLTTLSVFCAGGTSKTFLSTVHRAEANPSPTTMYPLGVDVITAPSDALYRDLTSVYKQAVNGSVNPTLTKQVNAAIGATCGHG